MILAFLVGLYCLFRKKITVSRRLILVGRQAQVFGLFILAYGLLVMPYLSWAMRKVLDGEQAKDYSSIANIVLFLVAARGFAHLAKKWIKNEPVKIEVLETKAPVSGNISGT